MVGRDAVLNASELLAAIRRGSVRVRDVVFCWCPAGGGESRPIKAEIRRAGVAYISEEEIKSTFGNTPIPCVILR